MFTFEVAGRTVCRGVEVAGRTVCRGVEVAGRTVCRGVEVAGRTFDREVEFVDPGFLSSSVAPEWKKARRDAA